MRRTGVVAMVATALLISGCNRSEARREKALDARARQSHFEPPATMSRAEFGGMVERRFHALDKDGDGYLSRTEWPKRPERFNREDGDGNGKVSAEEFGTAALSRFDARDTNHDGTVTQPEWLAAHRKHQAERAAGN